MNKDNLQRVKERVQKAFENKELLVTYVRNENRAPVATVVGSRSGLGVSVRNPKDKCMRHLGIEIAFQRSKVGDFYPDVEQFPVESQTPIMSRLVEMNLKCDKYFRKIQPESLDFQERIKAVQDWLDVKNN